jgi:hypothetical protein
MCTPVYATLRIYGIKEEKVKSNWKRKSGKLDFTHINRLKDSVLKTYC